MKNLKKDQKLIVYVIIALSIITLLLIVIYKINTFENTSMPKLNYESEDVIKLNNYIASLYESVKENEDMKISYKKYNSDKYVSLVFKINIENKKGIDAKKYIVSVVDKNNLTVLEKSEIANIFGYDLSYINQKIKQQLRKFYNDEVKEDFINSNECNFECYLSSYRKIENIEDFYYLSIEKDKLVAYLKINNSINEKDIKYFDELKNPERLIIN